MPLGFLAGFLLALPAYADTDATVTCDGTPSCVTDLRLALDIEEVGVHAWLGEAAKTAVLRMDAAHDLAKDETGVGLYYGNHLPMTEGREALTGHDCTTFVLEVLGQAYRAAGLEAEWLEVFERAVETSGADGFKGIDLMKALQELGGWEGAYFNPDVAHPSDASDEHPYSAYLAEKKGSYYGVEVDHMVVDYRPTYGSNTEKDSSGMDWLKTIPFGIVAARGGKHMAMIIDGDIYEVHWKTNEWSKDVITQESLLDWSWLSGGIVFPSTVSLDFVEPGETAD